jgi:hypothetical protein
MNPDTPFTLHAMVMTTTNSPSYYAFVNQVTQELKLHNWSPIEAIGYTNRQQDRIIDAINVNKVAQVYSEPRSILLQVCLDENFDLFIPE